MTDKTATQNLTRAQSTDPLRDAWLHLHTLGQEVDRRIQGHYSNLATVERPPFALLRSLTKTTYNRSPSPVFAFTEVQEDTAGLADLSADSRYIYLKRAGYWMVGGYLLTGGVGGAPGEMDLRVVAGSTGKSNKQHDGLSGTVGTHVRTIAKMTDTTGKAYLTCSTQGTGMNATFDVVKCLLWAYWLRDL